MFCNQCEETARNTACVNVGVCGKDNDVSALQDLLVYAARGLSVVAVRGREHGVIDREADVLVCEALFTTVTNVNFDAGDIAVMINHTVEMRDALKERVASKSGHVEYPDGPAAFIPAQTITDMVSQAASVSIENLSANPDLNSLQQTLLYGLRGMAAYVDHAHILGQDDDEVYAYMHQALADIGNDAFGLEEWVEKVLKCGEVNIKVMELLDTANTGAYGHPVPTEVPLGPKQGKAIVVSGHDLRDLELILQQSEGKGITVYTHGEMLPCHGYPELKKYKHFYGHYGTAWQNQQKEFAEFPGAILMTTNCIRKPRETYSDNIFTSGVVGWPGVKHISDDDFSPVIQRALELPGFPETVETKTVTVGFGHNTLFSVADTVIEAVKNGAIRHFFLVGGCDGARPGRNYYTEFVEKVPEDCVVLTLACGKFRFFDQDLGDIGGIPRLLDVGQCNDAYSAVRIAQALADAFGVGVNELPLSMVLSWYEQKAVVILLSLLALGIKNIKLGPSLPAFITPNVLDFLVQNYNIQPIATPDEDLAEILG